MSDQAKRKQYQDFISPSLYGQYSHATTLNYSFMMFEFLVDLLLVNKDVGGMEELIQLCKVEYQGNELEEDRIAKFQEKYTAETSIEWYTKDCFVYRILNKALRFQDIDVLVAFRFFITDIHQQLTKLQQDQKIGAIKVYRGQMLPVADLEIMKRSIGKVVSFHSFLSTTYNRHKAVAFVLSPLGGDTKFVNVLFEIECTQYSPRLLASKPFADISALSCMPEENEVLFTLGTHFRVEANDYDRENEIYVVKLNLVCDTEKVTYFKQQGFNLLNEFASNNMCYRQTAYQKHEERYHSLIKDFSNDELRGMIYIVAGNGAGQQKRFDLSLNYLYKALCIHRSIGRRSKRIFQIQAYICRVHLEMDGLSHVKMSFEEIAQYIRSVIERNPNWSLEEDDLILTAFTDLRKRESIYCPVGYEPDDHNQQFKPIIGINFYDNELDSTILKYQRMIALYAKEYAGDSELFMSLRRELDTLLKYRRKQIKHTAES